MDHHRIDVPISLCAFSLEAIGQSVPALGASVNPQVQPFSLVDQLMSLTRPRRSSTPPIGGCGGGGLSRVAARGSGVGVGGSVRCR